MKIEQVKKLDDGVSGITIEGRIIKTPKPPNNGEYGWSQMIILKDDTGEIGSWIKIASAEDAYKVGQYIKVQGKVSKYMKGDKPGISLNNGQVIEEIIKEEKTQGPAQSSGSSGNGNGTKDNYWVKKFKYEVERDPKVQLAIVRQCAIKAAVELMKNQELTANSLKKLFKIADDIVDYIFKDIDLMAEKSKAVLGGETKEEPKEETKEERTKKAEEVVGKTRFKPASTDQKNIVFGYTDKEGKYHKGIIDSRYIETHEIKEIGDPKKLSVVEAFKWIEFWWGEEGNPDDIGARKQREIDNPRDENGKLVNALVKGDKTSVTKDMLVDEIYALRRENRLNDNEKFKEVMGYNPKIEELTEAECIKVKGLLKNYVPF